MLKPEIITAVLVFASAVALAHAPNLTHHYNLDKMRLIISSVNLLSEMPQFEGSDLSDGVQVVQYNLDPYTKAIFDEIQVAVFGSILVNLSFCQDCYFYADYPKTTVFIQPSAVEAIKKKYPGSDSILRYVFAHELSHFLHEISSHPPYSTEEFVTINGLPSAYKSPTTLQDFSFENMLKSHAEVDVYAVEILKKMNFKGWEDVFKFFEDEISGADPTDEEEGKWIYVDFSNRLRVIRETISSK